ncbi:hypothetical protein AB6E04_17505 [Vibrio amylolyticus]|uniref:hypothetical protein n=1 Tax=Vibrio amylolyticus TaxID=2847292 RepID=UPI00354AFB06
MKENYVPFEDALIEAANLGDPNSVEIQVAEAVLNRCIKRGFITIEDKDNRSKLYLWLREAIESDYQGLRLQKSNTVHDITASDIEYLKDKIDDISESLIDCISHRILERTIPLLKKKK